MSRVNPGIWEDVGAFNGSSYKSDWLTKTPFFGFEPEISGSWVRIQSCTCELNLHTLEAGDDRP